MDPPNLPPRFTAHEPTGLDDDAGEARPLWKRTAAIVMLALGAWIAFGVLGVLIGKALR